MSLSQALATAVTGLRASQAGISIVAANVANAETPGYVRKTPVQVATAAGDLGVSVRVAAVSRELDQYVQRQMRVESSGASYADLRAQFYDRLQNVYGVPGADSTLETVYNKFTSALQNLTTSPDSPSARTAVLSAAQVLTQQLNSMTGQVQGLRTDAELGLADSVRNANDAMQRIAQLNQQLGTATSNDGTTAGLLDQRDRYIDQLAQLMDINVVQNDHNQVTVFTSSGIQLVGIAPATLSFDAQGSMTATAQWNADPSKRTVGTIVLRGPNGGDVDLVASHAIRSGKIAAYLEMRDQVLVGAQGQLDQIAAGLASALSDQTVDGSAVNPAPQQFGFDIDLNGVQNGNTVRIAYTDNTTGAQHTVTVVRVDDPSALPLQGTATADPNDKVIGLDFSGGAAGVASQLNAALATSGLQFSNTGTTLRVLDDGAFNKVDVGSVSAVKTATSLTSATGGTPQLPFFLDASTPYTGAITSNGPQDLGLAGRLAVNASLMADPSRLVVYQTSPLTPTGDTTRASFIYDQLANATLTFSPRAGIGTTGAPFAGTLQSYMRQAVSQQGDAAQAAANLKEGQDVVYNALQERFNNAAGVNVDQEMANLLNLQNSYAANARVLSAVKDMINMLFNM